LESFCTGGFFIKLSLLTLRQMNNLPNPATAPSCEVDAIHS
jgi:hypothetical protein